MGAAVNADRDSDRMWWPWKVFFGVLVTAGLLVAGAGVLLVGKASGPYSGLAAAFVLVAVLVMAAIIGVNVALYRAGRTQPRLRKAHAWLIVVVLVATGATIGVRKLNEPPPWLDSNDVETLIDECKVTDVRPRGSDMYEVILDDGGRWLSYDVGRFWAQRDC